MPEQPQNKAPHQPAVSVWQKWLNDRREDNSGVSTGIMQKWVPHKGEFRYDAIVRKFERVEAGPQFILPEYKGRELVPLPPSEIPISKPTPYKPRRSALSPALIPPAVALRTHFLPITIEAPLRLSSNAGNIAGAAEFDAVITQAHQLLNRPPNQINYSEYRSILGEGVWNWYRGNEAGINSYLSSQLVQGQTVEDYIRALSEGRFSDADNMLRNGSEFKNAVEFRAKNLLVAQRQLIEFMNWALRTDIGVSYNLGDISDRFQRLTLYIFFNKNTMETTISTSLQDYQQAGFQLMVLHMDSGIQFVGGMTLTEMQGSRAGTWTINAGAARKFVLGSLELMPSVFASSTFARIDKIPIRMDVAGTGIQAKVPLAKDISITLSEEAFATLNQKPQWRDILYTSGVGLSGEFIEGLTLQGEAQLIYASGSEPQQQYRISLYVDFNKFIGR